MKHNFWESKLLLVGAVFIFLTLPFLHYQKMPLNDSMTFNSSIENQYFDEKKNNNYDFYLVKTNSNNNKYSYDSSKFMQLSPTLYAIILALSIPIIIFFIVIFVPSKKITDNMIALDLNKNKKKKEKQNLGIQKPKRHIKLDDENL